MIMSNNNGGFMGKKKSTKENDYNDYESRKQAVKLTDNCLKMNKL